jgi:hypothetical protein
MATAQTPRDAIFQTILDMVADWLCLEWALLALLTRDPVTCVPTSGLGAPSRELKQPPSLACDSIEALARRLALPTLGIGLPGHSRSHSLGTEIVGPRLAVRSPKPACPERPCRSLMLTTHNDAHQARAREWGFGLCVNERGLDESRLREENLCLWQHERMSALRAAGSSFPDCLTVRIASSSSTSAQWLVRVTPCDLIDRARRRGKRRSR